MVKRRVVVVVLDGLRRDFVDPVGTPALHELGARACRFMAHRSVFPSATRVVSASFATGCYPARHGLQGNAMALLEGGRLVAHDAGLPGFLAHKRTVSGRALAVPTLAERLVPHGGAVVFSNVSPGAAYAHDPDGFGHVFHRAGSFAPGRVPLDPLPVRLDSAGDRETTERFIGGTLQRDGPALSLLWCGEPDHIQHNTPLGSPLHRRVLAEADRNAGLVIDAVDRMRAAGEDVLLIVCSDHGHETVSGIVDVEAELIAAGLKSGPESDDVLALSNGTATLVYLHPDHEPLRPALADFLCSRDWAGVVLDGAELETAGQAAANALSFAVSFRAEARANEYGIPGCALAGRPHWGDGVPVGCGQHGGLAAYEQAPFLMIEGAGFQRGGVCRSDSRIVDLAPTILHHLGVEAVGLDGRALQMPGVAGPSPGSLREPTSPAVQER
jgi:arylsulfatase A-like enzyme